jgi:hypothetical protein
MTSPSRMVIWGVNDRTTKGLAMKVAGFGGVWLCVARLDRFAVAVDRSPRSVDLARERSWKAASVAWRAMRPTRAGVA